MSVVPFRLLEPLAIVSLDGANWKIAMFSHGDCASWSPRLRHRGAGRPYVVDMYQSAGA